MSPTFRQTLLQAARESLPKCLLGFHVVDPAHPTVVAMFERRNDRGLSFFVRLLGPPDREEFTIDVGWSRDGKYPVDVRIRNPLSPDGAYKPEALTSRSFRLRADRLWGVRRDHWWRLRPPISLDEMLGRMESAAAEAERGRLAGESAEQFNERLSRQLQPDEPFDPPEGLECAMRALLDDACEKIRAHVLPYFEAVEAAQS